MKKLIMGVAVSATMVGMMTGPVLAVGDGSHASACGAIHGAFADVNGNFGWLGAEGGAAGYHGVVGQASGATGYNNSHTACQE